MLPTLEANFSRRFSTSTRCFFPSIFDDGKFVKFSLLDFSSFLPSRFILRLVRSFTPSVSFIVVYNEFSEFQKFATSPCGFPLALINVNWWKYNIKREVSFEEFFGVEKWKLIKFQLEPRSTRCYVPLKSTLINGRRQWNYTLDCSWDARDFSDLPWNLISALEKLFLPLLAVMMVETVWFQEKQS